MAFDPEAFRKDFPLLQKKNPPIYFDNACVTLRPRQVISSLNEYYEEFPACSGRSLHALSKRVDDEVYRSRKTIQKFIGAKSEKEIIFQKNATEGINLVAQHFPFERGDVILVGEKEHNSNLLPWQLVAKRKGLVLDVVPSGDDGAFSLDRFKQKLEEHAGKVRMVAMGVTANLDGSSIPAKDMVKLAHKAGSKVFLDAAQSVPHQETDVRSLGADFLAFSGHKMLGPSGIGVLYGREEALLGLDLANVGGETVEDAWFHKATWEGLPHRFEAGLQHYAGIIGLGTAAGYLKKAGLAKVHKHEQALTKTLTAGLQEMSGVTILGPQDPALRGGITSFTVEGMSHHDVAMLLSASKDIMIRSGAHCVHAWFNEHHLSGSARASLYFYNTIGEVRTFLDELGQVIKVRKPRRKA